LKNARNRWLWFARAVPWQRGGHRQADSTFHHVCKEHMQFTDRRLRILATTRASRPGQAIR